MRRDVVALGSLHRLVRPASMNGLFVVGPVLAAHLELTGRDGNHPQPADDLFEVLGRHGLRFPGSSRLLLLRSFF